MKSTLTLIEEGDLLKFYRYSIGMKQCKAAELFNTNQGNYSKMERGQLNCDYRLSEMKKLFIKWRVIEIKRLNDQIKFLNSF